MREIRDRRRLVKSLVFFSLSLILGLAFLPGSVRRSFAADPEYVGVYWDPNCTQRVRSIDWNQLSPGSTNHVEVFVRNEGRTPAYLYLCTANWTPPQAANYIALSWNNDGVSTDPLEVVQSTLTLRIVRYVHGITDFDFEIIIWGQEHLLGDVNRDGAIELLDAYLISQAFGSTPSDPNWNPAADLNYDDIIELFDFSLFSRAFHL